MPKIHAHAAATPDLAAQMLTCVAHLEAALPMCKGRPRYPAAVPDVTVHRLRHGKASVGVLAKVAWICGYRVRVVLEKRDG